MTIEGDSHDREVLAAEYVLGTVDPAERVQAQALMVVDRTFGDLVRKWERRLGELNVLIAPVEPPPATWDRIKAAIDEETPRSAPRAEVHSEVRAEARAAEVRPEIPVPEVGPASGLVEREAATDPDIRRWRRRVRRWRRLALATTALAAALIAGIVVREMRPDLLPEQLQSRPGKVVEVIKTVEVPSPKPAQYVAILQKDATAPAFLLTFDLDRKLLTARKVGAEDRPGKSYELWLISNKFRAPRSLGLIGTDEFTERHEIGSYDAVTINSASYAVSVEPPGGSPTGVPTGPVVYTGKLVQTTPPGFGQTP
jgi:anti-sigma-K factor RskA